MKHLFIWVKTSLLAFVFILTSLASSSAQSMPIPQDAKVRIGKLENGLTYYIRKNDQPAKRADFYIAQKVGSIQEEPNQRGLAHFLEHMCFNGTTHFPGNSLTKYLESIGVKFGENLNAYTSIGETVYNITNVPIEKEGAIDSCLYILHDWSNDLLLEPKEIDKERGVITEEWRTRNNAGQRFAEGMLKSFFKGTKYEDCLPIGSMEVVNGFEYQTLRDYYEKWYRPDLQGIIIVGDIDVDAIENKIKSIFSDIPAQPNAAKREYYPVPDNEQTLVYSYSDKEQPYIMFSYYSKYDAIPRETKGDVTYLALEYMKEMIQTMLNTRLDELTQEANPPFVQAQTYNSAFILAETKDAFNGIVICNESDVNRGITTLLDEIERVRKHGFTASEYARAKANFLTGLESLYNEREKTKTAVYVQQYIRHFLDNEPAPGIEFEYTMLSQLANNIPVEAINQLIPSLIGEKNKALSLFTPEKEGLTIPTDEELIAMLDASISKEQEPYQDEVSDEPLLSEELEGGKIIKEEKSIFNSTTLTLSNGVKVIVKPTELKADQIYMTAISPGGTSVYEDSEYINFSNISLALVGGIGNFSETELNKVLAGKKASVHTSVTGISENVVGSCTPKDFETMMQLTYLNFTAPRKDEKVFQSSISRSKEMLKNQELNPQSAFSDSITIALYNNHPRSKKLHANDLDLVNYDRVIQMYKERFADASDFTFVLVGNIDLEKHKSLIEKYLGSLPSLNRKESFVDRNINFRKGYYKNEFIRQQDEPKASILSFYNGEIEYNRKNLILMNIMEQVMRLVYTEKVREDEGGTYGVGVQSSLQNLPKVSGSFLIVFDTDPAKKEKLMEIIYRELDVLCEEGPSDINLAKVKKNMIKKHSELTHENSFWTAAIIEHIRSGVDLVDDYENIVESINKEDVKQLAQSFFGQKNKIEVIMLSPAK